MLSDNRVAKEKPSAVCFYSSAFGVQWSALCVYWSAFCISHFTFCTLQLQPFCIFAQ